MSEFVETLHSSFQQLLAAVVAGGGGDDDDEWMSGSFSRRESCTVKKSRTGKKCTGVLVINK